MDCGSCEWKRALANRKPGKKIPGGNGLGKCTRPEGFCDKVYQPSVPAVKAEPERHDVTTHLSSQEKTLLEQCEAVIEKNIEAFFEAGHALAEIRDRRLYREKYKTFEQYCKQEWDFGKAYANRQIGSYEAIQNLKMAPMGAKMLTMVNKNDDESDGDVIEMESSDGQFQPSILPQNERQTRPLTKLNSEDQVKAWSLVLQKLNDGKKLTSFLITQAVKEVKGERTEETVQTKRQAVTKTSLVSSLFKRQYQVMLDIISDEMNSGWKTSSKNKMTKWLKEMIKVVEEE